MSEPACRVEISVVVPVYNSARTIPQLCKRMRKALASLGVSHEIILVDDGSADGSFEAIRAEAAADPAIRPIKLVRNFGQHPAITAGLLHSRGNWVVLTDDDLQTPPEEIGKLYRKAGEGFDIVCGARAQRKDGLVRRLGSGVAHWLMVRLFEDQSKDIVSSFRILSRRVVDTYLRLPETHTYVAALISWLGYPQTSVPVRHETSKLGRSRYSFFKLLRIWLDMAFGFTDRPLKIAAWTGVAFSLLALVLGIRVVVLYLTSDNPVPGYASLFVSQMFFFGLTLVFMGILGEYVARVYREVKRRPYFIIDYEKSVGLTASPEVRDWMVR
jgi:dolichol-phosphate mannosyltransferase